MKNRLLIMIVIASITLAGCQKKQEIVQPTTESIVTEETLVSEDESSEETSSTMEEGTPDAGRVMTFEDNLENMLMPMDALMMCVTENGYEYGSTDPTVFWASLYYTLGNYGTKREIVTINGSEMIVPSQIVQEFATALFADYDNLPEIPGNLNTAIRYDEGKDAYVVSLGDRGLSESRIYDDYDNGDGTYTVMAKLCATDSNSTICDYKFILVENQYADGVQNPLFYYSIKSMTKIEEK